MSLKSFPSSASNEPEARETMHHCTTDKVQIVHGMKVAKVKQILSTFALGPESLLDYRYSKKMTHLSKHYYV